MATNFLKFRLLQECECYIVIKIVRILKKLKNYKKEEMKKGEIKR